MAQLTAITSMDMDNWPFLTGVWGIGGTGVSGATPPYSIVTTAGSGFQWWLGSGMFIGDTGGGVVAYAGTLNRTVYFEAAKTQYVISGLNHDMSVAYGYVVDENPDLLAYLFNVADTMNGSRAADTMSGFDGNDAMYGNGGADELSGLAGRDSIEGGTGADTLSGGRGADTLQGDDSGDLLTGGSGADQFVLAASAASADVINDFQVGIDRLVLDGELFTRVGATGALAAERFASGAGLDHGLDANDRIVYDTASGGIYYDSNGSAAGGSVLIATLNGHPAGITASDFIVA